MPVAQAVLLACGLLVAWRWRASLTAVPIVALTVLFQLGWLGVHLLVGAHDDFDGGVLYRREGTALLHGHFPAEQDYPPGAVLLFALEVLLGGGGTRLSNTLLMIAATAATVAAIVALRTRSSAWLAALIGLSPLTAFSVEHKFDAVPALLLVAGLLLVLRERFALGGSALALGATMKWIPAIGAIALFVALAANGRRRAAVRLGAAFLAIFVAVQGPFLLVWPHETLATLRSQAGRGITSESLPYLPLKLVGLVGGSGGVWVYKPLLDVPAWAKPAAVALQLAVVAILVVAAARAPSAAGRVAAAALACAAFFLTNRVFSPQYMVEISVALAAAAALVAPRGRAPLFAGALLVLAQLANAIVYPGLIVNGFVACSALLFATALSLLGWLAIRALELRKLRAAPLPAAAVGHLRR